MAYVPFYNGVGGWANTPATTTPITAAALNYVEAGIASAAAAFAIVRPSGDATGATDAAAINSAVSGLPTSGGVVFLAPGYWYVSAGVVSINRSGVYITGAGKWATFVAGVGTGDVFRMYDSSTFNTRQINGGGFLGLTVSATGMGAGSSCVHVGDISGLEFDLVVQFAQGTGSVNLHLDNNYAWTENMSGQVWAIAGTQNVKFDNSANTSGSATGSFDRCGVKFVLSNQGVGHGLVFSNGAIIVNPEKMGVVGNFNASSTAVYSVIYFDNSTSTISNGLINIGVELDSTGTYIPTTFKFNNSGYNGIHNCTGIIDFASGSSQFATSNNSGNFIFCGEVYGDSTLTPLQTLSRPGSSQGSYTNGQTFYTGSNGYIHTGSSTSYSGVILQAGNGDNQTVTIKNAGTGSLTFAVSGTSNVAGGVSVVIAGNTAATFYWDTSSSLWYRAV